MIYPVIELLILVAIYYVYRYFKERREDAEDYDDSPAEATVPEDIQEETIKREPVSTKQLALKTIEDIGSKPEYTEEGRIRFEYQGIVFLMEARNDCLFVNLIWPWCYSFSKFDIDEFARVRQVINDINTQDVLTVFYSISDSDEVAVHVQKQLLFVQEIPQLENYLKTILNSFFRVVRTLNLEIEKCKLQECEKR